MKQHSAAILGPWPWVELLVTICKEDLKYISMPFMLTTKHMLGQNVGVVQK